VVCHLILEGEWSLLFRKERSCVSREWVGGVEIAPTEENSGNREVGGLPEWREELKLEAIKGV